MTFPGVSKAAAAAIASIMERHAEEVEISDYVPAICWAYDSPEPECIPVPCIGAHVRAKIPPHLILNYHGLDVVFDLPGDVLMQHRNSVLDFVDGRFFFREKGLFRLFNPDAD